MRTRTQQANGYTRVYTHYGIGDPGYHERITRDSDGAVMYSGPYTDGEPQRHPDWVALGKDQRTAIRAAFAG